MRLVDADELLEHAWRDKLDSRELIAKMIQDAPTVKEIPTTIPIDIFERLLSLDDEQRKDIFESYVDILEKSRVHHIPFTAYIAGILNFYADALQQLFCEVKDEQTKSEEKV